MTHRCSTTLKGVTKHGRGANHLVQGLRSTSVIKGLAHSMESDSFQDHWDAHSMEKIQTGLSWTIHPDEYPTWMTTRTNLHGDNSFQDHQESTDFIKKTFATIYRLKSVASIQQ